MREAPLLPKPFSSSSSELLSLLRVLGAVGFFVCCEQRIWVDISAEPFACIGFEDERVTRACFGRCYCFTSIYTHVSSTEAVDSLSAIELRLVVRVTAFVSAIFSRLVTEDFGPPMESATTRC